MAAPTPTSRSMQQPTLSLRVAPASSGSQTQTQLPVVPQRPVLRLRGDSRTKSDRRIQWAEDVIDNEGMGRKSSKVCCIYHGPKPIDESSDESSSDSCSDDDGGAGDGAAKRVGGRRGKDRARHNHNHGDGDDCGHDHSHSQGKGRGRTRSPNAYEKMPKVKEGSVGRAK